MSKEKSNLLFEGSVPCGFPSQAEDYIASPLDLNSYLIRHPAATFFVRVEGESMVDAGIFSKDLLIVDRALSPKVEDVVLAIVRGDFTVKRLKRKDQSYYLASENLKRQLIEICDEEFQIFGVVIHVIHHLRK